MSAASENNGGGVRQAVVGKAEDGLRLDRWFKARFPALRHGQLEKLLRTGQIRLDGKRAKAADRVTAGQEVRLPPQVEPGLASGKPAGPAKANITRGDIEDLRKCVLYRDDHLIVLNKPSGLAVQGGSGTTRHVDAMLDGLTFGAEERPRLVHRLDRDTSGVLVLARSRAAATFLTQAFQGRDVHKLYWAVVAGVPKPAEGYVDAPLAKVPGAGGEKVVIDTENGQWAKTLYRVVSTAHREAAWVEFCPETGRTHQLRVHSVALETPILGDGKYGGKAAFLDAGEISKTLHLHARALRLPHPAGGVQTYCAPLPPHMAATFSFFGFEEGEAGEPFDAFFE